jgi:co-chaperonin GroES (HSP10)
MDTYEKDQLVGGLIDTNRAKGSLKEYQTVIAIGDTVRGINVGDIVCIDPTRYMITKHNEKSLRSNVVGDNITIGYKFNTITIDDKECLMLYDQDITFVVEESEDVEEPTIQIIQPEKPTIIV